MYLVQYSRGSFDDYCVTHIFVTDNKEMAERYVEKFNRIIQKAKEFYVRIYNDFDLENDQWDRYFMYYDINEAFIQEIEVR